MTDMLENRADTSVASGQLEDFLQQLIKRREATAETRAAAQRKAEAVLLLAQEQGREVMEPEEDTEYRGYVKKMKIAGGEILGLDERIDEIRGEVERSGQIAKNLAKIRKAETSLVQVKEQAIYQQGNRQRSYVNDLIKYSLNMDDTGECRDRLFRHAQDVATLDDYKEYRDLSRVDG